MNEFNMDSSEVQW